MLGQISHLPPLIVVHVCIESFSPKNSYPVIEIRRYVYLIGIVYLTSETKLKLRFQLSCSNSSLTKLNNIMDKL